MSPYGLVRG
ncbi:hypothetical protein GN958_ATG07358 [Phytophthora infestans]|uniref:Uncharacterized protein n=1 Tax=Phytophthora infestans TaxID=4787 RepID=A0A8S9USL4_PHYIN|nr:hypothetical protein GN958_ATG07358 [Phytophthora infestans]